MIMERVGKTSLRNLLSDSKSLVGSNDSFSHTSLFFPGILFSDNRHKQGSRGLAKKTTRST